MSGCCHNGQSSRSESAKFNSPSWRRALWFVLSLNLTMFVAETVVGYAASSSSLQADALDFLGDAVNYGISLGVSGMALAWRARAALLKGLTLVLFGLGVVASTGWRLWAGTLPHAEVMGYCEGVSYHCQPLRPAAGVQAQVHPGCAAANSAPAT